mgnify:CR=1 FL=1
MVGNEPPPAAKRRVRMKRTLSGKIFDVCNVMFMILLAAVFVYPYLNQVAISLNSGSDTLRGGITVFPREFTLMNYKVILTNSQVIRSTAVTVISVAAKTFLVLLVNLSAAYALRKKEMPYRSGIIWFLIIPTYISAGIIPTYILFRYLHLLNSIFVYILPGMFVFYNMLIIRTFLSSIPEALEEAALLDGAGEFKILFSIILPLSMPVIATVALWTIVEQWNDWTTTLYYVTDSDNFKLQYVIMQLIKQAEQVQKMAASATAMVSTENTKPISESIQSAGVIFSTLPIVVMYPFLQKYFVKGVTLGGVKD